MCLGLQARNLLGIRGGNAVPQCCASIRMNKIPVCLLASVCVSVHVQAAAQPLASLTQAPLVMRLGKDEFRIAFGIDGTGCFPRGCHGLIRYRVAWSTEDGMAHSEIKRVHYAVSPNTRRSIAVDRQYLDTAEGAHTTSVVGLTVDRITCSDGPGSGAL